MATLVRLANETAMADASLGSPPLAWPRVRSVVSLMTRLPLSVEAKLALGSEGERHLATRIQQMGLPKPEREFRFDPERRWRFDFAWPEYRLAVEVEGAVWAQGRHTRGSGAVGDMAKYNAAAKAGWAVLRFPTEQVMDDSAIYEIVVWFEVSQCGGMAARRVQREGGRE